ncbi:MAG: hypothetical protein HFE46_07225 [Clostridia bacterium]|jgi:hypothetical protein|nr:hypothetical protein [Clostridia bacterium]
MFDIDKAANILVDMERGLAPYDTGNLMNNGITSVESVVFGTATYWINKGGANGRAPYGVLLNEAMFIRGNNNVHYHWHDNAFYYGCLEIAAESGGELL